MNQIDHDEALKFMLRTRVSIIHKNIDRSSPRETANALGRLLADLNSYMNGLPE